MARELRVGNRDATEIQVGAVLDEGMRGGVPQFGCDAGDELARADDGDQVALIHGIGHRRTHDRAGFASAQAREGDLGTQSRINIAQAGVVVALDADRAVRQGRGGILVALAVGQGGGRGDEHSDDAEEVGNRVTDGRQVQLPRGLASGGQSRSVGH